MCFNCEGKSHRQEHANSQRASKTAVSARCSSSDSADHITTNSYVSKPAVNSEVLVMRWWIQPHKTNLKVCWSATSRKENPIAQLVLVNCKFSAGKTSILASTQMLLCHLSPASTFLQTSHTSHTASTLCYNCSLPQQIITGFNKTPSGMLRGRGKVLDIHMNFRLPKFHSDRIWSESGKSNIMVIDQKLLKVRNICHRPCSWFKTSSSLDVLCVPFINLVFNSTKKIYIFFNEQ